MKTAEMKKVESRTEQLGDAEAALYYVLENNAHIKEEAKKRVMTKLAYYQNQISQSKDDAEFMRNTEIAIREVTEIITTLDAINQLGYRSKRRNRKLNA